MDLLRIYTLLRLWDFSAGIEYRGTVVCLDIVVNMLSTFQCTLPYTSQMRFIVKSFTA